MAGELKTQIDQAAAQVTDDSEQAWQSLPVLQRLLLAAAVNAATGRPLSVLGVCETAGVSRGSAYNHHKESMAQILAMMPALVDLMVAEHTDVPSASELAEQVQQRDARIAELRRENQQLKRDRDEVSAYARALHAQVKEEFDIVASEKARKVRRLRPLADLPDGENEA